MTKIRRSLPGFMSHHQGLRIDQSEGIDDNFAFDRLYRVDDYGDCARCELFEGLLCVDING